MGEGMQAGFCSCGGRVKRREVAAGEAEAEGGVEEGDVRGDGGVVCISVDAECGCFLEVVEDEVEGLHGCEDV